MGIDKIDPSLMGVLGAIFIMREVFSFIKAKTLRTDNSHMGQLNRSLVHAIENVSEHIAAQTDLIKGFAFEMKEVRRDMDELKLEFRRNKG